jgi:hypothetical protein
MALQAAALGTEFPQSGAAIHGGEDGVWVDLEAVP